MSRKPKKGYFVRGQFVAEGSELDLELKRDLKGGDEPSKTELKAQSTELQGLGEDLLGLRSDLFEALDLPGKLVEALSDLKRISNFEGRRRQSQFIGKLMRRLEDETIEAIRAALEEQRKGSAKETLLLHTAENWRARLVEDDTAVAAWIAEFPDSDSQQVRALVRQARKDAPATAETPETESKGLAPRKGRAWRELFQFVRKQLAEADGSTPDEFADSSDSADDSQAG